MSLQWKRWQSPLTPTCDRSDRSKLKTRMELAERTAGLVSRDEFAKRRLSLEQEAKAATDQHIAPRRRIKQRLATRKERARAPTLSFAEEDDDDQPPAETTKRLRKDPAAETSFLPDRARDDALARRRQELSVQYEQEQEARRAEPFEVPYSFWDGRPQKYAVTVRKGTTVERFLSACCDTTPELRKCSAVDLILVKDDLIIPQSATFLELIVSGARGKAGPLFSDEPSELLSAGHLAKVMERRLYDRERRRGRVPYKFFEPLPPSEYLSKSEALLK